MKKTFLICFLQNRQNLNSVIVSFLHLYIALKKDPSLIDQTKIVIASSQHNSLHLHALTSLFKNKCDLELYEGPAQYLDRLNGVFKRFPSTQYKYFIKHDDDINVSQHTWIRLLQSSPSILRKPKNVLLSVNLTTGIPRWYQFCQNFLNKKELQKIASLLKKVSIPSELWRHDYSLLSTYVKKQKQWDEDGYWNVMNRVPTEFKGLHPIRIFLPLPLVINLAAFDRYIQFQSRKVSSKIETVTNRYLCNNFFVIDYRLYQRILRDKSLALDIFDEIPINLYRKRVKGAFVFLKDSLGIHYLYNSEYDQHDTIDQKVKNGREIEDIFVEKFRQRAVDFLRAQQDDSIDKVVFYTQPVLQVLLRNIRLRTSRLFALFDISRKKP